MASNNLTNKVDAVNHIFRNSIIRRNESLTFTNGSATLDYRSVFTTNEFVGIAIFPYNNTVTGKVTSSGGILTITTTSSINGTYYCSFIGFYN